MTAQLEELLKILVCPACRKEVSLAEGVIVCVACGRRYPVRNGIPIMLTEELPAREQGQ